MKKLLWLLCLALGAAVFPGMTSVMAWTRTDTLKVEADSGDGRGLGTDFSRTGEMYHGYLNGNGTAQSYHWMRSLIPSGQTIDACTLWVRANGNITGTDTCQVMFEYANDVDPPTSVANWNGRTVGDSVQWLGGGAWVSGTRYPLNLTTQFRALYNAGYCDSNEYLTVFWKGRNVSTSTAVRRIYGFDISTSYVTWLIVTHTTTSTGNPGRRRKDLQTIYSLEPQFVEWTKWERVQ